MASVVTVQPRLFVVKANQSRACLSVSERERRDIPVSVGALGMIDVLARYVLLDDFVSEERVDKLFVVMNVEEKAKFLSWCAMLIQERGFHRHSSRESMDNHIAHGFTIVEPQHSRWKSDRDTRP
jgi:hypothetical protein